MQNILITGATGFRGIHLVPPRDSKSLADALKILIENPELRKKMGARGRKIVEAEFSEEIVVKQTMEIYKEIIRRLRR